MAVVNKRTDQLDSGVPSPGDYGMFWSIAESKLKKYVLPTSSSDNFEWSSVSAVAGEYDTGDVVTYGGNWYQSTVDNNEAVPGTDATWTLLTKGNSGLLWAANSLYTEDLVWVFSDHNGYPEIFYLASSVARPFLSTDIEAEEAAGKWLSLTQLLREIEADSSASPTAIDFEFGTKRIIVFSDPIAAAHEFTFSNADNIKEFEMYFQISALPAPITFPASVEMPDANYDNTTKIWTPLDIGYYYGRAIKFGAVYVLKLERINK